MALFFHFSVRKSGISWLCFFASAARFGAALGARFLVFSGRRILVRFLAFFLACRCAPGGRRGRLFFLALVWGAWAALVRSWRAPWAVRVAGVAAFFVSMVGAPVRRGCALLRRRVAGACARAARGFCCCGWALARCVVRALGACASLARRAGVALVARSRPSSFRIRVRATMAILLAARACCAFVFSLLGRVSASLRAFRFAASAF